MLRIETRRLETICVKHGRLILECPRTPDRPLEIIFSKPLSRTVGIGSQGPQIHFVNGKPSFFSGLGILKRKRFAPIPAHPPTADTPGRSPVFLLRGRPMSGREGKKPRLAIMIHVSATDCSQKAGHERKWNRARHSPIPMKTTRREAHTRKTYTGKTSSRKEFSSISFGFSSCKIGISNRAQRLFPNHRPRWWTAPRGAVCGRKRKSNRVSPGPAHISTSPSFFSLCVLKIGMKTARRPNAPFAPNNRRNKIGKRLKASLGKRAWAHPTMFSHETTGVKPFSAPTIPQHAGFVIVRRPAHRPRWIFKHFAEHRQGGGNLVSRVGENSKSPKRSIRRKNSVGRKSSKKKSFKKSSAQAL